MIQTFRISCFSCYVVKTELWKTMAATGPVPTARVVFFDIREASPRDSRFQTAAQVSEMEHNFILY